MEVTARTNPVGARQNISVSVKQAPVQHIDFFALAPLLELMPVAVGIFGADERLIVFNGTFRAMQGPDIAPNIVAGISFAELVALQVRFKTFPQVAGGIEVWRTQRLAAFRSGDSVRAVN